MADLTQLQASLPTIIVGSDLTGNETTPVGSTTYGALNINVPGIISVSNSTTTVLGISGTFIGPAEEVTDASMITIQVFTDQATASSGFKPQYSIDGTNWDDGDTYTLPAMAAGNGKFFSFPPQARYFRLNYTNGAIAQTVFRLQTIFRHIPVKPSSHRIDDTLDSDNDAELVKSIITGKRVDGTFDTVKLSNVNEVRSSDISDNGGVQGALTVGTTAVLVNVSGTNLTNRKLATLLNNSSVIVYWGYTNAVTTSSGTPIRVNQERGWTVGPNTNIYVIAGTASNNARVTERA